MRIDRVNGPIIDATDEGKKVMLEVLENYKPYKPPKWPEGEDDWGKVLKKWNSDMANQEKYLYVAIGNADNKVEIERHKIIFDNDERYYYLCGNNGVKDILKSSLIHDNSNFKQNYLNLWVFFGAQGVVFSSKSLADEFLESCNLYGEIWMKQSKLDCIKESMKIHEDFVKYYEEMASKLEKELEEVIKKSEYES